MQIVVDLEFDILTTKLVKLPVIYTEADRAFNLFFMAIAIMTIFDKLSEGIMGHNQVINYQKGAKQAPHYYYRLSGLIQNTQLKLFYILLYSHHI